MARSCGAAVGNVVGKAQGLAERPPWRFGAVNAVKNLLFAIRPLAMDLASTLVFVAVGALTHDPILATAIAVAVGFLQVVYLKLRGHAVSPIQWMSLGLVLVFGGATLFTHNARFMMFKPTIVYVLVGSAMLQRGWMLPYLPPVAREHVGDTVMIAWGYVWAGLMFATALTNVAFALLTSFAVWTAFIAVAPLVSKLLLFAVQYLSIRRRVIRRRAQAAGLAQEGAT
jgi:intracellular septation protein A